MQYGGQCYECNNIKTKFFENHQLFLKYCKQEKCYIFLAWKIQMRNAMKNRHFFFVLTVSKCIWNVFMCLNSVSRKKGPKWCGKGRTIESHKKVLMKVLWDYCSCCSGSTLEDEGWRLWTTKRIGSPEFLMASTATFCSDEVRVTLPTCKIRSPVKSWPVAPAGLSGKTFLTKIPELTPSTLPPTIERPKLWPSTRLTSTSLWGPQTLASPDADDDDGVLLEPGPELCKKKLSLVFDALNCKLNFPKRAHFQKKKHPIHISSFTLFENQEKKFINFYVLEFSHQKSTLESIFGMKIQLRLF